MAAADQPADAGADAEAADVTPPTLTAEELSDAHPMLPDGWRRSMSAIRRRGGPWGCPACGGPSYLTYRCSSCGKNLAGEEKSSAGRSQGGRR